MSVILFAPIENVSTCWCNAKSKILRKAPCWVLALLPPAASHSPLVPHPVRQGPNLWRSDTGDICRMQWLQPSPCLHEAVYLTHHAPCLLIAWKCVESMDLLNCSSKSSEKKPLNQLVNNALGFDIWTYQKHFQMCMTVWSVAKELKFSQLRTNPKMLFINLSWPPQSQTTTGSAHLFHFLFWSMLTAISGMCIYIYVCISVEPGDPSKCPWITSAAHCI